ncbi:uncharacterized protein [Atheta coriaria]|uniref:uncharacterized protein isoform X2 n=1 Tax=Dalotia coriaria TaxID=877792 RepID=UPI0031F36A02
MAAAARTSFALYALLIVCVEAAVAQFIGQQSQPFNDLRRPLSTQQQGHILSDIQHRFNVQQQQQQPLQPLQQFQQQFQQQQVQFPQQFQQQPQLPQQFLQPTQQPVPQQFLQPTVQPTSIPFQQQQSQVSSPNRNVQHHIQHHTQTSFTPNFQQQAQQLPQTQSTALPTVGDAIFNAGIHQNTAQIDPEKQKQRLKELKEKQAIIDKHNQFVEKQYEKALKKAQQDHSEFLDTQKEHKKKLYQNLYKGESQYDSIRYTQTNPRYIYPEETELFKLAVKKYYEEHPTTTTTTTTTPKPTTTTEKPRIKQKTGKTLEDHELYLSSSHSKLYSQIKSATDKDSASTQTKIQFLPTAIPTKKIQNIQDLSELQKQYKNQQIKKDDLLAQLRLAIGENADDELSKNITSREISLPNGQRVQIIRTSDPKSIPGAKPLDLNSPDFAKFLVPTTTGKPPKAILEELTKGVIPPGADFELLKHGTSGLEQIGGLPQNIPNQKKVTFVLLEEQNDGSFKVQGVKGNSNGKEKTEVDVDSILKKIKDGEIKLPPNTKLQTNDVDSTSEPITKTTQQVTINYEPEITVQPNVVSTFNNNNEGLTSTPILRTNIGTHFVASTTPIPTTYYTNNNPVRNTTPRSVDNSPSPKNVQDFEPLRLSSSGDIIRQTTNDLFSLSPKPTNPSYVSQTPGVTIYQTPSTSAPFVGSFAPKQEVIDNFDDPKYNELPEVLKRNGLFAMARFLRQSGLDTILNETGPYTVFAPTDKAFRTLLVQLGGPEKAEDKFKENPRLLSGLLLHHVIPGAFKIETLQDEMTGVSLAGTQLRVNQYNMHDLEWNDIKITTINGAKVMDDKKDIEIPQGIAHAVDRVMFPLPVGDIVQTLQSDRERRFTSFLRALFASGLAETLQGTKTFTLFAPTDKAFVGLTSEELTRTVSDRVLARELVMRHLAPGTLYTNGMRYYQIRDSLEANRQITLSKSSGRVKVNNSPIITQNIPATNGVIHALDSLL